MPLSITPAPPTAWAVALDLVFQHLPAEERGQRRANALAMLDSGEIHPHAILIARTADRLVGAMVCVPLKGSSCLFWPPQVTPGADPVLVADSLVRHGLSWLRTGGAKIAQAIVPAADLPLVAPLLRCGFRHITRLQFLRHHDAGTPICTLNATPLIEEELSFETYQPSNNRLFHETLERTYEGTLDCPELNGRRGIEEVIAGHQSQGRFRPELWCLARHAGQPVGVMMLADAGAGHGWEMAYLGVVPERRGQGIGWALATRALNLANQSGAQQLMVAVDARNRPAQQSYAKMGFVPVDEREVLLFFFEDLADAPFAASPNLHQTTS